MFLKKQRSKKKMVSLEENIVLLQKTEWFGNYEPSLLSLLAEKMKLETYKANAVLLEERKPQNVFFVIKRGSVIRKIKDTTIGVKSAPEVTGLLHSFEKDPAHATLVAGEEGCEVLRMYRKDFLSCMMNHPELTTSLLSNLARAVRKFVPLDNEDKQGIRVVIFAAKSYEMEPFEESLLAVNEDQPPSREIHLEWVGERLSETTALRAAGAHAVVIFTNDNCNSKVIDQLHRLNVKCIALRCAGFNNVDLEACKALGIEVVRVPSYSPESVAEHAVALMMMLNRKIHTAVNRTRQGNFDLNGLTGFCMHGKTVAIIGTGKIGRCTANIMKGFGTKIVCFDAYPDHEWAKSIGASYAKSTKEAWEDADIVSLHVPLLPSTEHLVNKDSLKEMKKGVMIINTSRGKLIKTVDLVEALKSEHVGYVGVDVYDKESKIFFEDHSYSDALTGGDEKLALLSSFHNVIITGHLAFLTKEALQQISSVTLNNIAAIFRDKKIGDDIPNRVL